MSIKTIGVIGLGAIGGPMGRHLVKAGFTVVGYDVDDAVVQLAVKSGLREASSPREIAHSSDLIMILVGHEKQVDEVIFGPDGILEGARPGTVLGLGATVSPTYAQDLSRRLEGSGLRLLDMPTARSHLAADEGTLLVFGGADPETFELCRSALESFATDIFHLGPFGSGQVAKMVNNMILWACMAANDEGLRLGEQLGIDQDAMREALVRSSAANFPLIERSDTRPIPWAEKDMAIAQHEADRLRISLPVLGVVKEAIKAFKIKHNYPTPGL